MSADATSGQLREIVVGISEAPTSQVAARRAVELAAMAGARVHFVTAVERVTQERVGVATDVADTLAARWRTEHCATPSS